MRKRFVSNSESASLTHLPGLDNITSLLHIECAHDICLYTSRHAHLFRACLSEWCLLFSFTDKCIKLLKYAASTCNKIDTLPNAELQHSALTAGAVLFSPPAQVFFIILANPGVEGGLFLGFACLLYISIDEMLEYALLHPRDTSWPMIKMHPERARRAGSLLAPRIKLLLTHCLRCCRKTSKKQKQICADRWC